MLLYFDNTTSSFELLLEGCSLFLADSFLDYATVLAEILSFLDSETCDRSDFLDTSNLLCCINGLEIYV